MSYTSSFTSDLYSSPQYSVTSNEDSASTSSSVEVTVQASSPDSSDGLYAVAGADALAAGEDTLATADISGEMVDGGTVTSVDLTASALAAAESTDGDTAFTSADTFAAVSDGTELLVTYTEQSDSTTQDADGSTSVSTSTTQITGLDIDLADSTSGYTLDEGSSGTSLSEPVDSFSTQDGTNDGLDGNVATAEFDVTAVGENTFAEVDAFVIAIEDELSLATISAQLAVD